MVFEDAGEGKVSEGFVQKRIADLKEFPNEFDTRYGPYYDQEHLIMRNNPIEFDDGAMIVKDGVGNTVSKYYITPGLMELMFNKKLPETQPSEQYVGNYKDMLIRTLSAYKNKDIKQGAKVTRSNRSNKYVGLISRLVKKEGGRLRGRARYRKDRRPWHEDEEDFEDRTPWNENKGL